MIRAGVKLVHGIFPAWRIVIYQMFIIVYNNTIIKRKRHTFDTRLTRVTVARAARARVCVSSTTP